MTCLRWVARSAGSAAARGSGAGGSARRLVPGILDRARAVDGAYGRAVAHVELDRAFKTHRSADDRVRSDHDARHVVGSEVKQASRRLLDQDAALEMGA